MSFIIDFSYSILFEFNFLHAFPTIAIMLIAPSIIENNEDIFIDIIVNIYDGVKIVDYN